MFFSQIFTCHLCYRLICVGVIFHRPVHVVLSSPVSWAPEVRPSSRETAPEKKSPGTALRPGWEMQFTGGKASEPPAGKKRPYCSWTIRLQECVSNNNILFRNTYPCDSSNQINITFFLFGCAGSYMQHVRSSSLTSYGTQALCIQSMES